MGTDETTEARLPTVIDVLGQLIRIDQVIYVYPYTTDSRKKMCTVWLTGGNRLTLEGDVSHSFAATYKKYTNVVRV